MPGGVDGKPATLRHAQFRQLVWSTAPTGSTASARQRRARQRRRRAPLDGRPARAALARLAAKRTPPGLSPTSTRTTVDGGFTTPAPTCNTDVLTTPSLLNAARADRSSSSAVSP